jgi:hypothetical protein
MKKCLYVLLNKVFKKDLELLYGKGSLVEITDINYCTNDKHFSIHCKLLITDTDLYKESTNEGLEYLLQESWKYTGIEQEKLAITTSVDIM